VVLEDTTTNFNYVSSYLRLKRLVFSLSLVACWMMAWSRVSVLSELLLTTPTSTYHAVKTVCTCQSRCSIVEGGGNPQRVYKLGSR
jgi:hypothetical protein